MSQKPQITISLDLETLCALMGGEAEAVVKLREGIVQEFARRHLKAVANEEVMSRIRDEVIRSVHEELPVSRERVLGVTVPEIGEPTRSLVRNTVHHVVSEEVVAFRDEMRKLILEGDERTRKDALKKLDERVGIYTGEWLEEQIRRRLGALLERLSQEGGRGG